MYYRTIIKLITPLLIAIIGCSSEGCYEETDSEVIVGLFETDIEVVAPIDSITIFGTGLDDQLLYENVKVSSVALPLFAGSDKATFIIINGLVSDTLEITYTSRYNFISKECGYNYNYTIESLTFSKHRIDTVLIINNAVTTGNEENLRTFF